ncbi:winged helix-turn-helix domain-containing protein [Micromonospora sp. NPDC005087]|uniref:winged helix-turn-helix domain-containing protein n=1 Tax=Micromonospora sp. NPDC005087 TaxID=3364225 RepID=UPI003693432E
MVAHLDGSSLARLRLAISPAAEVTSWLRAALSRFGHPVHGDPGPAARAALRHPDVALVAALVTPPGRLGYTPDLLTPKPPLGPLDAVFDQQLAAMAATPAGEVATQVHERFPAGGMPARVRAAVEDGTLARRVTDGLRHFWLAALAEQWPSVRATLEAELAVRATAMATAGVGSMLNSLHPKVGWTGRSLTIDSSYRITTALTGAELVLAPSALAWPQLSTQLCDEGNAVLVYPIGAGRAQQRRAGRLDDLVGASRAAILADLDVPRSTGQLSERHRLAPATVSYHLGVLLRSGLVVRARERHSVLYRRSAHGDELIGCRPGQGATRSASRRNTAWVAEPGSGT